MARKVQKSKELLDGFRLDFNKDYKVEGVNMDYAIRTLEADFRDYLCACYGLECDDLPRDVFPDEVEAWSQYYNVQSRIDLLHDMRLIDYYAWHNLWFACDCAHYYWVEHYKQSKWLADHEI